mgnify:CR=1 FL=1|tara:strand:- start:355 stop:942 length:588 start_codon:yes stop_codon:yes gene_type:complete
MVLATIKDKTDLVNIISTTFDANPSVNIVIGDKGNRRKRIKLMAGYAFIKALNRDGAYLSENKKGIALFYRSNYGKSNLKEIFYELRFALALPVKKVFEALKREAYLKKYRYQGEHFYFWFFGVQKGGGKAGFDLKNGLYQLSEQEQLPIILETSVARNKIVYERYGFKVYHQWSYYGDGHTLWFMKRDVPKLLS